VIIFGRLIAAIENMKERKKERKKEKEIANKKRKVSIA